MTLVAVVAALLLDAGPTVAPVDITGDDLTGEEIAARFADRLGVSTSYVEAPLDALGDDEDSKARFRLCTNLPACQAEFARTRTLVPSVENLEDWPARARRPSADAATMV